MLALRFRLIAGFLAITAVLAAVAVPLCAQSAGDTIVKQVKIEGNYTTQVSKLPQLRTREGQAFDPVAVKEDVRSLSQSRKFLDVNPKVQPVPGGVIVIFQVVERPTISEPVVFVGNQDSWTSTLRKKTDLSQGQPLDPYAVEEARRRVEQYYREKGYTHATITTLEGSKPNDHRVVFMVDEGTQQKVSWVSFEGNKFEGHDRLLLQCTVKPFMGYFPMFGSKFDRKKVNDDVDKLTAYYRSFGYFQAKISPTFNSSEDRHWVHVTYVINEGPRYTVRNVAFLGNEKFKNDELNKNLEQISGKPFNQLALNRDRTSIQDVYGEHGYVFADIQPENHLSPDKPEVDIVYNIAEGKRYRVGNVNIHIAGDNPHTNQSVILNRMTVHPGDIVNTKKLRDDERRLKFASVFNNDPTKGDTPKITFDKPDGLKDETYANKPGQNGSGSKDSYRSQSPDDEVIVDPVEVHDDHGNATVVWIPRGTPVRPAAEVRFQSPGYPSAQGAPGGSNWSGYTNSTSSNQSFSNWNIAPQSGTGSSALPRGAQPLPPSGVTDALAPPGTLAPNQSPFSNTGYPTQPVPARGSAFQQPPPNATDPLANQLQPGYSNPPAYTNPPAYANPPAYTSAPPSYSAAPPAYSSPPPSGIAPTQPAYSSPPPGSSPYVVNQQGPVFETPYVSAPPPQGPVYQTPPVPGLAPGDFGYIAPDPTVNLNVNTAETQTGRLMLGVGVNSDAGLVGNFVIDEQNFDITRLPNSWDDISNGTAWRGAGQRLRLEANPGTVVQRYAATFQEPYLFNLPIQFAVSGFYFTRIYEDWNEGRVGGNLKLGYLFTPDFSGHVGFDGERVDIYNPHKTVVVPPFPPPPPPPAPQPPPVLVPTPELARVLGSNDRYDFNIGVALDTRDSPFLPTQGHLVSVDFDQIIGSFIYPRVVIEGRQYYLLRQRADGSGRHVIGIGGVVGVSGDNTPIYDNFFAGGFSSLRGFAFRGASPIIDQVRVGGTFEALGTVEYLFPITADDALRGVVFCDFGTVEQKVAINGNQFRAAPGFGLRITVPAMGPAPIALDLAFPVANAPGDQIQNFAFFVGLAR